LRKKVFYLTPWEEELKSNSVSQSGTIPSFEGWIGMPDACSWKEQRDNGGRGK